QAAQGQLTGALSRLMVVVERYPELKSNQNFLQLQSQLEGTENRIAVERRRFNEAVRDYNTRLQLAPGSIVARLLGFTPKAFFEAPPDAATPPKVKFWPAGGPPPRPLAHHPACADRPGQRLRAPADARCARPHRGPPDRARAGHRRPDGHRHLPLAGRREP